LLALFPKSYKGATNPTHIPAATILKVRVQRKNNLPIKKPSFLKITNLVSCHFVVAAKFARKTLTGILFSRNSLIKLMSVLASKYD
jgi:hypothetical protein